MKKRPTFQFNSVVVSLSDAIAVVEEAMQTIEAKKKSICTEIQSVLGSLSRQPCDAKLVCQIDGIGNASMLELALIGDFSDWDDIGFPRYFLKLRQICDGDVDEETLSGWLSHDALNLVMQFQPEILRVSTESAYLKRLSTKLWRMHRYAENWISRRGFALENLDHFINTNK